MTQKICMNAGSRSSATMDEQIRMIRGAGFDGIFFSYAADVPLAEWIRTARAVGLEVQSLHAPFDGCAALWEADDGPAEKAVSDISDCIRSCAEYGIGAAVSHVYIGFDGRDLPKEKGLERYARLVKTAEDCGVTLAFENTEGEQYLDAVLNAFKESANVGFCLDTGHEICYNRSADLLLKYGRQLVCTHLNDNLGISAPDGRITYMDDLHLLPFDGVADWENIARRLVREHYDGPLTFELSARSKPGRHENDGYADMPPEDYFSECRKRADRFRRLVEKIKLQSK